MKLATKMFLGAATLAVVPVLVTSLLVGGGSVQLARGSLTDSVQSQLTSLREVRKQQITDYLSGTVRGLQALSASTTTLEGFKALKQGYQASGADVPKGDALRLTRDQVKSFYDKQFGDEYARHVDGCQSRV